MSRDHYEAATLLAIAKSAQLAQRAERCLNVRDEYGATVNANLAASQASTALAYATLAASIQPSTVG